MFKYERHFSFFSGSLVESLEGSLNMCMSKLPMQGNLFFTHSARTTSTDRTIKLLCSDVVIAGIKTPVDDLARNGTLRCEAWSLRKSFLQPQIRNAIPKMVDALAKAVQLVIRNRPAD